MRQLPPDDEAMKKRSMASTSSSSSTFYFRQSEAKIVTEYHQMPPQSHRVVIEMEPINQLNRDWGFSSIDCSTLKKLVNEKSLDDLVKLGGVEGIGASLRTDMQQGIGDDIDEISGRSKAFGSNSYTNPPTKSFLHFVQEAFSDSAILILLVCAALSLGFGIKVHGPKDGWYNGGSIFVAAFLVILVSAISNFRQNRQLDKLSKVSTNMQVGVVRSGRQQQISTFEIVVGDVVCLKIGDQVPADGLFIGGYSLQVDESSMTGESHWIEVSRDQNPFLLSGSKVIDGCGKMLVTSVGMNTSWGEMMSTISSDSVPQTPLQGRLSKLTSSTGIIGLSVAFLVLVVLLVRYFIGNTKEENGKIQFIAGKTGVDEVINAVVGITTAAVTIVVVAIPEALPLAVTLTLAYSMRRMTSDRLLVRNVSACESMGSITTICADITSILSDQMNVTKSFIGKESLEGRSYTSVATNVLQLLVQGISLTRDSACKLFKVTPVDDTVNEWAVMNLNMEIGSSAEGLSILEVEASCPEKKRIGIVVRRQSENMIHVHWRGDFERILSLCSHYYDITGNIIPLDDQEIMRLHQEIEDMGASGLQCIAYAHTRLSEEDYEHGRATKRIPEKNLTLLAVLGLKRHCRLKGVKQAIETCQLAGVTVKMITGEDLCAARFIARECGIQEEYEGSTVTGEEFRMYDEKERMEKAEKIRIMSRSSPLDKLLMVRCLKQRGHTVAATGHGISDIMALKEADVGLSIGIQGTEIEKESSDVIILDDDFSSLPTLVRWGRCVYNNINKLVQFQLTVNIAALVIISVAAVSTGRIPLTPAQFLWVSLIMDTFGALALATEEPSKELMSRPPVGRHHPLITNIMWRNIGGQAFYQIAVILILKFKGKSIFHIHENVIDTLVFTTFVLLQVFNMFNARKHEEKNVFKGILKNKMFLVINGITVILQIIMVELLNKFAHTERLNWTQWGVSIGVAAFTWPIGLLLKFIPVPDKPILNYPTRLNVC